MTRSRIIPVSLDSPVLENDYPIDTWQILQLMCDENSGLSPQILHNALLEHMLAHVRIHGA